MAQFDQIMRLLPNESLPSTAPEGTIAYNTDEKTHYLYSNGAWGAIPPVSNLSDMSQARKGVAVSEFAAYTADVGIAKKTRGAYINGQFVYGITPYILTAVTNGAGKAIVNITDDMTTTGSAIFSLIPSGGITASPRGVGNAYQVTSIDVSTDMKTVTVSVNQLGSVALGLVSVVTAAAGVSVDIIVWGKS